jgi:hypothetical protein
MGRYLHDHMGNAVFIHFLEKPLQVQRLRGGHGSDSALVSPAISKSPDNPDETAGLLENTLDEKGGGRFAVCPRYANEVKIGGRVFIEIQRKLCKGFSTVGNTQGSQLRRIVGNGLGDDHPGSPLNGIRNELTTIHMAPAERHKNISGLYPAAVIRDAAYRYVQISVALAYFNTFN